MPTKLKISDHNLQIELGKDIKAKNPASDGFSRAPHSFKTKLTFEGPVNDVRLN